MNAFSDELQLLWTLALNVGLFAAAYRFSRRRGTGGALQAICDAFVLYFLTQYAAVALPGVAGVFNAWTMSVGALIAAGTMAWDPWRNKPALSAPASPLSNDHLGMIASAFFAAGYIACYAWSQRYIPPIATDALVYHLPTAVQWIQTHRLGIYPTWYWNPAASYSPGTGSMFMAWWIAPAGNEIFVRFVQIPPLLFIFFIVARMCRLLGCSRTIGGLIGAAAVLSRPLFSEAIIPKDDLYVTSFVAAGVLALTQQTMREKLGPWRIGVLLGLVLASKYTVLLACPIFLFLVDAPFRARWTFRQWIIAIAIIALLALPWYVRNIVLTGNPLYPVDVHLFGINLPGLFTTERDQQLRTAGGIWHMLSDTYHSVPTALLVLLAGGWGVACALGGRYLIRQPLARACVIGSIGTIVLFLITSPHHEVRYVFPLLVLLFVALGMALARVEQFHQPLLQFIAVAIAIVTALISVGTSFSFELIGPIASLTAQAAVVTAIGVGIVLLQGRVLHLKSRQITIATTCAMIALLMGIYVQWHAYVDGCRDAHIKAWTMPAGYPWPAETWQWIDQNVPPDGNIAYANTFFIYPLYGFDLNRRVGYAPVRKDLHEFLRFPRMGDRVPGDLIVRRMTEVMNADADRDTWLENLRAVHAEYLIVMKYDPENPDLSTDPPEMKFARSEPAIFMPINDTEAGTVFRINWK